MKTFRLSFPATQQPFWLFGLALLAALLPLPLGANRPWAGGLFSAVSAVLFLGMAYNMYRNPSLWPTGGPVRRLAVSGILITFVAFWAFLQTQSWMPASWHHPLWQDVKDFEGARRGAISIDPDAFPEALARMLAYGLCFLMAFIGGRNSGYARFLLKVLAFTAAVYAVYGLLMQALGLDAVLWYKKWAYHGFLTSTFVNKNSYATFAGLGLQACLALLWQKLKRSPQGELATRSLKAAWLEKILRRDVLYLVMVFIVLAALILSGSRGGMASSLVGCAIFLTALVVNKKGRWTIWLPVLALGIGLFLVFAMTAGNPVLDRLDQGDMQWDLPLRLSAYEISLRAIAANPWRGFGLGGFETAFRLYSDPGFGMWFQHAHNDYLELVVELGVPAGSALFLAVFLMISCCLQGVFRRRRQEIYSALGLSASVTVCLHSLVDFSMHIPAVAATYAVILGLGVAQSWSTRDVEESRGRFM